MWKRLALFLIAEHAVILLQSTVQFLIPESADDVEEVKLLVWERNSFDFLGKKGIVKHLDVGQTELGQGQKLI